MDNAPHLDVMEQAVLGCVLDDPSRAEAVFRKVSPDDFGPRTQLVAETVHKMHADGEPITAELVLHRLRSSGKIRPDHGVLVSDCLAHGYTSLPHLGHYVDALADVYLGRRVSILGARIQQMVGKNDVFTVLNFVGEELARLSLAVEREGKVPVTTLTDILAEPDTGDSEWLIPGLLPASDRLMIVGGEGSGKSVALRQFALSYALGLDPFELTPIPEPGKALLIDCENSRPQVVRALRGMYSFASRHAHEGTPDNLVVESRQRGIDLCEPYDQRWFLDIVRRSEAKVVCIGPLYRIAGGDINVEETVRCWQRVMEPLLDSGISIVMEHHSPHGMAGQRELRPIGSSALRRWFSQGVALKVLHCDAHGTPYCRMCPRAADVEMWRGSRDETWWPRQVRSPGAEVWWMKQARAGVV